MGDEKVAYKRWTVIATGMIVPLKPNTHTAMPQVADG